MTQEFVDQIISARKDYDGAVGEVADMRFVGCKFVNCTLSRVRKIESRTWVRNVTLEDCSLEGCHVGAAVLEDVRLENVETSDLLLVFGALFRHVTFAGRIGKLKINTNADSVNWTEKLQAPFDRFREQYYSRIDWAIDISKAQFREIDFSGIPARLVRRDPETQIVVTRARALEPAWRERLSPSNKLWPFVIDLLLSKGHEDCVLVAPLGAPKRKRDLLLKQLQEVRESGVAEPS